MMRDTPLLCLRSGWSKSAMVRVVQAGAKKRGRPLGVKAGEGRGRTKPEKKPRGSPKLTAAMRVGATGEICVDPGCDLLALCKSLCQPHYHQLWRKASKEKPQKRRPGRPSTKAGIAKRKAVWTIPAQQLPPHSARMQGMHGLHGLR